MQLRRRQCTCKGSVGIAVNNDYVGLFFQKDLFRHTDDLRCLIAMVPDPTSRLNFGSGISISSKKTFDILSS